MESKSIKITEYGVEYYEVKAVKRRLPYIGEELEEDVGVQKINTLQDCTTPKVEVRTKFGLFNEFHTQYSCTEILSSCEQPLYLCTYRFGSIEIWLFKDRIYLIENDRNYDEEHVKLLVLEHYNKERKKLEKLKEKYLKQSSGSEEIHDNDSRSISESVRKYVWRRDGGKCVKCGNREKLEFDHIIPASKGGSNTSRNVELLCERCNREKSNNV